MRAKLETITNVLIIVAVIAILISVGKFFIDSSNPSKEKTSPEIGTLVKIEGFDSSKAEANILFVMQKDCRFCEESIEYFQKITAQKKGDKFSFYAVFPPSDTEVKNYLNSYGFAEVGILSKELSDLNVRGTPTVIVTNRKGEIVAKWVGKLSESKQLEFEKFLDSYLDS
jgi:thioredoxin-related protein